MIDKNQLSRAQKALAENMVMAVKTRTARWTYFERKYFDGALYNACNRVGASLNLKKYNAWEMNEHYVAVIEKELVDTIRVARTYHDMTAEEIIQTLEVVNEVLRNE